MHAWIHGWEYGFAKLKQHNYALGFIGKFKDLVDLEIVHTAYIIANLSCTQLVL